MGLWLILTLPICGKNTRRLIDLLKEKNIPLILTSAKTRLEQNMVRKDLGLTDPYIIENGGAVVIPKGYFSDSGSTRH